VAVLVGAVAPLMLKTDANPGGLPIDIFDPIRTGSPPAGPSTAKT